MLERKHAVCGNFIDFHEPGEIALLYGWNSVLPHFYSPVLRPFLWEKGETLPFNAKRKKSDLGTAPCRKLCFPIPLLSIQCVCVCIAWVTSCSLCSCKAF